MSNKQVSIFAPNEDLAIFENAQRQMQVVARSSMVPAMFRGNAGLANAMIASDIAASMGRSTFEVMQNMHEIHGKVGFSSSFLIGVINSSGVIKGPLRYEFKSDNSGCRAVGTCAVTGERLEGSWVTMVMAKEEGWIGKKGSKWKTIPEQMMRYRAASFWQRIYAPNLSSGIRDIEEIRDQQPEREINPIQQPDQSQTFDLSGFEEKPKRGRPKKTKKDPEPEVLEGELVNEDNQNPEQQSSEPEPETKQQKDPAEQQADNINQDDESMF